MRPKTLAQVAELAARGESFDHCLANFLDEFSASPDIRALADAPPLLAPQFGETGRVQDAYRGDGRRVGTGQTILHGRVDRRRFTEIALSVVCLTFGGVARRSAFGSPAAFRSRNLFVSENALTRA